MKRSMVGRKLVVIRERRMWTQARLADEAGVSPTTVSAIESGRISRPHFGTLRKLARALEVEPDELISSSGTPGSEGLVEQERPAPLSLEWARSVGEEEFEQEVEDASMGQVESFSEELREERGRLQRLYAEFPEGSEQRRFIKRQIREVSAQSGLVTTSIMFHREEDFDEGVFTKKAAQEPGIEEGPSKLKERTVALRMSS